MKRLLLVALVACSRRDTSNDPVETAPAPVVTAHEITLPKDEPTLPPGPGREAFVASCTICHSPRYLTNQPRFPRDVWQKEVAKMTKTFGAPVPPDQVDAIVGYLVQLRGE